ncbi:MAG: CaiB/BaiF CoA-transferase family protein [Pseudomonadota bacterium]
MPGPLAGLKIIEMVGIGPGPFAGMLFADQGAEVVAVDRAMGDPDAPLWNDPTRRNKRSIALDMKKPDDVEALLRLVEKADAIFEGYRPGVAERLGVGPDECLKRNPKIVYGRMTGWGQEGPLSQAAGHDINYIALTGALAAIGPKGGKPVPPLNLVGDYGGGAMFLVWGMMCALWEAERSGQGQVIDAAMVDGAATLMAPFIGFREVGFWKEGVGEHMLAGVAHFYDTYETRDGKYVALGSIEPKFHAELIERLGLDRVAFEPGTFILPGEASGEAHWPALKEKLTAVFKTKTRDEWTALLEGTDVCFAPVLTLDEAPDHPHMAARETFTNVGGAMQNAPAPRFSRTPADAPRPAGVTGADTEAVFRDWGVER